ncbi:MAG: hypothetical protein ACLUQC_11090 [Lactococcus raffinolactis]
MATGRVVWSLVLRKTVNTKPAGQSGGYWYWLDPASDGAMQTGYFNVTIAGGSTASFYANDGNATTPYGALYQNCWLRSSDGNWFYANAEGDLAAGWLYQNGTWYYLDPVSHVMQVGFVSLGSGKYYLDASGAMKTGWILLDGNWYWAYSSGALASSWQSIGGARYYFDQQTLASSKVVTRSMEVPTFLATMAS